jgi:hypothetical protein
VDREIVRLPNLLDLDLAVELLNGDEEEADAGGDVIDGSDARPSTALGTFMAPA